VQRRCTEAACLLFALSFGCGGGRASDTLVLRIHGSAEHPLSPAAIRYAPADNVLSARLSAQGWLAIERRDASRALTVEIPEWCPVTFPVGPRREPIDAQPVIDLGPDRAPVGFDAPFAVAATHRCARRGRGQISWRQVEGARISELAISPDGFQLNARTPRFETLHPELPSAGILAFSPRTQGRVVLEALWRGPGSPPIRRSVTLVSTSRSTGLSSVAVSQQMLLAGAGWRVRQAPQAGHAQVHASGALCAFTPDAPGRWALERDDGRTLAVQAFWHDKTPYDCGRRECHSAIAETTSQSPMSFALEHRLGEPRPAAVGCMLDCHALGERGLRDGGFLDVAGQLGFTWLASTRWQDLPQTLRRLGGVRCTACHGPGALPELEGRELVLRSDVCATCHDAPPRYVHVQQWRASRMARSDAAPITRTGACAACHTTAGFLERVAGRSPRVHSSDSEPTGISCAACHAPHDSHRGARLLRSIPDPSASQGDPTPLDPRSALCVKCHAPTADETQPSASSGVLWQGSVRVPTAAGDGWEVVRAPSAHRSVPGGCIGCHGATPGGTVEHSFRVDKGTCKQCHAASVSQQQSAAQRSLQERARALAQRLEQACAVTGRATSEPAHAAPGRVVCRAPRLRRAMYELYLVLEDPAASAHNAALARSLLEDAERLTAQP
jgi:hypothetical protein